MPALILLDLMMPEMDGFEFLPSCGKNEAWESIPVVVLTSKDLTPEERARLTGNVEQILQKGAYSRDALLREVRKIVAQCAGKPGLRDGRAARAHGGRSRRHADAGSARSVAGEVGESRLTSRPAVSPGPTEADGHAATPVSDR